jgi:CheY-like chemotaxis protein
MPKTAATILLVDDDVDFLSVYRCILEPQGYRVVCCHDGQEAWEHMQREKPDLVITDLMMNTLDAGFSFSEQVKTDPRFRDVPVIIATAITSTSGLSFRPKNAAELAAMHVDGYFDKPVPGQELIEKVAQLLARRDGPA